MYQCKCKLPLQPVQWKSDRLIWCCSKIVLPVSMRCKFYVEKSHGDHCQTVVEFLNYNDKAPSWHQFNESQCSTLRQLCQLHLRQPIAFSYTMFMDMVNCLNSYDTNMDEAYTSASKKRNTKVVNLKPTKRKVKKRKLDPVAGQGQLMFEDLKSVKVNTKRSDKMNKKIEEMEEQNRKWIEENFRTCNCPESTLLAKQTVREFDEQGNKKKNAFRKFWSCRMCNFFLWEDDLYEYYK